MYDMWWHYCHQYPSTTKHNIRQHSPPQLSRAILKLRNLKLPQSDPVGETFSDDEEYEENTIQKELGDINEILGLPTRVEALDEVIELGPTENADDLQVQSRLVKNSEEMGQKSSQVIEVKENHQPPPCHINPLVEDPDAIIVKFNQDMVMTHDKSNLSNSTLGDLSQGPARQPRGQLRAVAKRTIQIPNPSAFTMDFKATSRSADKYIMQNVGLAEQPEMTQGPPAKRRRGRPRKNQGATGPNKTKSVVVKKEVKFEESEEDDEEELKELDDPPLFSDDEDEEDELASVPNITRTRSGRTIKIKKEDEAYNYYDMPSMEQMEVKDSRNTKERKASPNKSKFVSSIDERMSSRSESTNSIISEALIVNKDKSLEVTSISIKEEISEEDQLISVVDEELMEDENSSEYERSSVSEGLGGCECFMCYKTLSSKEEYDKHLEEHFRKAVAEESINKNKLSPMKNESRQEDKSCERLDDRNLSNASEPKETSMSSVCEEEFESQLDLHNNSQDANSKCKFCGKTYQSKINLQTHIKKYHEKTDWMKFKCATCGEHFGFLTALERHMKEHNPNQKFCCEQCGKVFKNLTNLKNHIPLHTKSEIFECQYCPKKYYIKYSYEKHVRTHTNAPKYHCEICDKSFKEKKQFDNHVERHQSGGSLGRSKNYRCNNCGDVISPEDLMLVNGMDSGYHKTCFQCGKGLYKRYMIESIDTLALQGKNERQREQCKVCGKCVINLARHMKNAHLDISYVPCDVCGAIVTKQSLPAHKNRKHGGSSVNCDHCNRVFKNIMCLREHMNKIRRKEDPAKNMCKFCKEIICPSEWKEHMLQHRTKCNDCGNSNFKNHLEFLAHLETCRKCSNCGMIEFTSREEYLDHIEVCTSSINIMTGALDSPNDQEVVTSIFAIVDESNCCKTCGEIFEDHNALAHHIAESHGNSLQSGAILDETLIDDLEAILYACPQESCGVIVSSKESLNEHVATVHGAMPNF